MYKSRRYKPRKRRRSVYVEQRIKKIKIVSYIVCAVIFIAAGYFIAPVILSSITDSSVTDVTQSLSSDIYSSDVSLSSEEIGFKWDYDNIKAIYVPANMLLTDEDQSNVLNTVKELSLNAVIIDVKRDDGLFNYNSEISLVKDTNAISDTTLDLEQINRLFKEEGIYTVARINCFKDSNLPRQMVQYSVPLPSGGLWWNTHYWLNPYNNDAREYLYSVIKEIASYGFCEIMLDEVKFPNSGPIEMLDYGTAEQETSKKEIIAQFINEASKVAKSKSKDIKISLSMDATAGYNSAALDSFDFSLFSVDAVSPRYCISEMIYNYNQCDIPIETFYMGELEPDKLLEAVIQSLKSRTGDTKIRPVIQDYTPYTVALNADFIKKQTSACDNAETAGFISYNPQGVYTKDGYK